ncbi:MAG: ABC transporter permease [Chloroflexota bacterium]
MSELEKLRVVIGYEFLKHIRRKRLYMILGLALLAELAVLILLPVLQGSYPDNVLVMAAILTVGPSLAAIGAVFFAGDAIAGEFESKTGFILFTNPVKRITLVIGKYIASFVAVVILVIFSYLVIAISLLSIYGTVPTEMYKSLGLALLFSGSIISITFLFSSFSKGAMGATVITLILLMVISPIIDTVLMMTNNPHWFLLSTAGDSIATVYGGYELFMEGLPFGSGGMPFELESPDVGLTALAMVIYLVVGFVASIFVSNRRQLA